jgi:hypothetical protein
MRRFKPLCLVLMVLAVLAVVVPAMAAAEPLVLTLAAKELEKLEVSGETKGLTVLEGEKSKTAIECMTTKTVANSFKEADTTNTNLYQGTVTLTGCKVGMTICRSETSGGIKDPNETILMKFDEHVAAGNNLEGTLVPFLMMKVAGVGGETPAIVNCGGVKWKIQGIVNCVLLPGLAQIAAGGTMETVCKQKEGIQIAGPCVVTAALCKELEEKPLEVDKGLGFEKAGAEGKYQGTTNRALFIDD